MKSKPPPPGGAAAAKPWFVYMLRCADGSLYTGITTDLGRRRTQHDAGTASRYTRGRRPVEVVHQEPQPSRSAALKREAALKALARREKEIVIADGKPKARKRKVG